MKKENIEIINEIAKNLKLTVTEDTKEVIVSKGLTSLTIEEGVNGELYYKDIKMLIGSANFGISKTDDSMELIDTFMTQLEENTEVHPF